MSFKAFKGCLGVVGGLEPPLQVTSEQVSDHQKSTKHGEKIGFFEVSKTACIDVI